MRTLFWIPLVLANLGWKAEAQPATETRSDAAISKMLSYSVPASDWQEHLKKRRLAGWTPPPLPSVMPAESAEVEWLADYWQTDQAWSRVDDQTPSAAVLERLLGYCEEHPAVFAKLAGRFSAEQEGVATRVHKLYDRLASAATKDEEARISLPKTRLWLMAEAGLLREEFKAEAAQYFTTPDDANARDTFDALLKHEPDMAKEMLLEQAAAKAPLPRGTALLHLHTMDPPPPGPWRDALQEIVTERVASPKLRAEALNALQPTDWPGKVEWVLSLFEDVSLGSVQVGKYDKRQPLAKLVKSAPDFWVPKVIPLVGSPNRVVHDNAVRCLVQFHLTDKREDALRQLVPWLSDPAWAQDDEDLLGRLRMLQTLDIVNIPESVPGLLWALEHDSEQALTAAASAAAHCRAVQAVPALRKAIEKEPSLGDRRSLIASLLKLEGMPLKEQVQALETYVSLTLTKENREALEEETMLSPWDETQSVIAPEQRLLVSAGLALCNDETFQSAALAEQLAKRIGELREAGKSALAEELESRVSLWDTPASARLMAARLGAGRVNANWLWDLFSHDHLPTAELKSLKKLPANTAVVVALLLEDETHINQILDGSDAAAQAMLLACARMKRAPLPLDKVARLLDSKHILCARGAELYLEAADSPQARSLLLQRFKGEARILGARMDFDPGHHAYGDLGKTQDMLRQRVLTAKQPLEIVALLSAGYWGDNGQVWVEISGEKAVLINDQGGQRFRSRKLTKAELAKLRAYIVQNQVDDLPPLTLPVHDGIQYEYVHLTAAGGRRVFMNNPGAYTMEAREPGQEKVPEDRNDSVYVCLVKLFKELVEDKSKLAVEYRIAEEVQDLRIIIPREQQRIDTVMRQDGVLLVSQGVPGTEAGISRWAAVKDDGTPLPQVQAVGPPLKLTRGGFSDDFMVSEHLVKAPWRTAAVDGHVRPATRNKDDLSGLWLCRENQEPELIVKGTFASPLTSLDGQWVVVARASGTHWGSPNDVVRINLVTREIIPLKLAPADTFDAVDRLPYSGKILVRRVRDEQAPGIRPGAGPQKSQYHLVDPATGDLEQVTGEFRPLGDQIWRPLQPTGEADVVWAALPRQDQDDVWSTSIGRYNLRSFTFTKLIEIPRIYFSSMDFWVDEEAGRAFLATNGDLLSFPLPQGDTGKPPLKQ